VFRFDSGTSVSEAEIFLDGTEYLIVHEHEVLGIAEGVPEAATA
jgi:hypothetical protein